MADVVHSARSLRFSGVGRKNIFLDRGYKLVLNFPTPISKSLLMRNWKRQHCTMGRNIISFQRLNNTACHASREQSNSAKYQAPAKKVHTQTQAVRRPFLISFWSCWKSKWSLLIWLGSDHPQQAKLDLYDENPGTFSTKISTDNFFYVPN